MAAFLVEIMRSGILLMQIYQRTREGKRLGAWATQYVLLLQYCNCNEENGLVLLLLLLLWLGRLWSLTGRASVVFVDLFLR